MVGPWAASSVTSSAVGSRPPATDRGITSCMNVVWSVSTSGSRPRTPPRCSVPMAPRSVVVAAGPAWTGCWSWSKQLLPMLRTPDQGRPITASDLADTRRGRRRQAGPPAGQDLLPADDRARRLTHQGALRGRRQPGRAAWAAMQSGEPYQVRDPVSADEAKAIIADQFTCQKTCAHAGGAPSPGKGRPLSKSLPDMRNPARSARPRGDLPRAHSGREADTDQGCGGRHRRANGGSLLLTTPSSLRDHSFAVRTLLGWYRAPGAEVHLLVSHRHPGAARPRRRIGPSSVAQLAVAPPRWWHMPILEVPRSPRSPPDAASRT
jgi:hypothetical protein